MGTQNLWFLNGCLFQNGGKNIIFTDEKTFVPHNITKVLSDLDTGLFHIMDPETLKTINRENFK